MSDFIELHNWAAFRFGRFEHRLCGYVIRENEQIKCIVSEPILGVNAEDGYVETTNNLKYKLFEPIKTNDKIDMMYVLDRWMNLNLKGAPGDATDVVLESLEGGKKE